MEEKYEKYLLIDIDDTGDLFCVHGAYPTKEDAKQEAEAIIIDLVEDGDFDNGCRPYAELKDCGAGIISEWMETELEDGMCIQYKYTADSGTSEIVIIPVPRGLTEPHTPFYSAADRIRIEKKSGRHCKHDR